MLLILILGLAHSAFAQQVETPSGKLVGSVSEYGDSISVFKGIPYALAPTGARRWTYAEAHPGWQTRNATRFSPACIQHPDEYPEGSFFARSSDPGNTSEGIAQQAVASTFGRLCQRLNLCR